MTSRILRMHIAAMISREEETLPLLTADCTVQPESDAHYYIMSGLKELRMRYPGAILMRVMAKKLEHDLYTCVTTQGLFAWFRKKGFLLTGYEEFNRPSWEVMKKGWMVCTKCGRMGNGVRYYTPYITKEGYKEFFLMIRKEGGLK